MIFQKADEETYESMQNLAKAVGGRLVKVKVEYEIMEEDGSELEEPNKDEQKEELRSALSDLLGL